MLLEPQGEIVDLVLDYQQTAVLRQVVLFDERGEVEVGDGVAAAATAASTTAGHHHHHHHIIIILLLAARGWDGKGRY